MTDKWYQHVYSCNINIQFFENNRSNGRCKTYCLYYNFNINCKKKWFHKNQKSAYSCTFWKVIIFPTYSKKINMSKDKNVLNLFDVVFIVLCAFLSFSFFISYINSCCWCFWANGVIRICKKRKTYNLDPRKEDVLRTL